MSAVSKKRKLDEPTKYYAVRAGFKPGVYMSWAECVENTTGFKGASFKSFLSKQDALDFVAGKPVNGPSGRTKTNQQEEKFYGVAVGRVPGVYTEWSEAQKQIVDVKGPKFKKFATREEAEEFVKTAGKSTGKPAVAKTEAKKDVKKEVKAGQSESSQPAAKKVKTSTEPTSKSKTVKVYTDGSSLNNGKLGALAGVGVYFGASDSRNVSEPLKGPLQTNQRAELTAILRALEIVPKSQSILIVSDSNYSINCCTAWYINWKRNGWKTSTGGPVVNQDLVEAIRIIIDERNAIGVRTDFEWIKGHSNDPSNEAVDILAKNGARASRV